MKDRPARGCGRGERAAPDPGSRRSCDRNSRSRGGRSGGRSPWPFRSPRSHRSHRNVARPDASVSSAGSAVIRPLWGTRRHSAQSPVPGSRVAPACFMLRTRQRNLGGAGGVPMVSEPERAEARIDDLARPARRRAPAARGAGAAAKRNLPHLGGCGSAVGREPQAALAAGEAPAEPPPGWRWPVAGLLVLAARTCCVR